jgi:hypothetical protein
MLMREMSLDISGLGFILYSPPAVKGIPAGSDFLQEHFSAPADVAAHVMACQLTAFCTGTPGSFRLRFSTGPRDESAVAASDYALRLGLQVHNGIVCVRDLYDLMNWSPGCPDEQTLAIADGWYRLTVFTTRPQSGILGDGQVIDIHLEEMTEKPQLRWEGVPCLCN